MDTEWIDKIGNHERRIIEIEKSLEKLQKMINGMRSTCSDLLDKTKIFNRIGCQTSKRTS